MVNESQTTRFSQEYPLFKELTANVKKELSHSQKKAKEVIKLHLTKIQKEKRSVYEFVDYVFDLIEYISNERMDPVMTSIAYETKFLLKNLKNNYDESSDYLSEEEAEIEIDKLENVEELYSPEIRNQKEKTFIEDYEYKKEQKIPETKNSTLKNLKINKSLSIVEERTDESEDEPYTEKVIYNPHYSSKINFGDLFQNSKNILQKWKDDNFLTIKDFQDNYIVHYIDKINTDFRLALEYLKNVKTTAINIETYKNTPSYIQFAAKKKCYIFNLTQIGMNENFKDFLAKFLRNRKNLKIVFDFENAFQSIEKILKSAKLSKEKWQSVYEIKQNLFYSKTSKKSLNFCCLRLFGKEIDDVYKSWATKIKSLGLNEIHYFSIRALSIYMMYLELKTSQKVTIQKNIKKVLKKKARKDYEILVDSSCAEGATSILDNLGCVYNQLPLKKYKGKRIFPNFSKDLVKIIKEREENLLVSDDKFLLGLFGIQNKIIFSDETKFKKGILLINYFKDIETVLMLKNEMS